MSRHLILGFPLEIISEDDLAVLEIVQDFPITGRDADPTLVIHGMEMPAAKLNHSTIPHLIPLLSTCIPNMRLFWEMSREKLFRNKKIAGLKMVSALGAKGKIGVRLCRTLWRGD